MSKSPAATRAMQIATNRVPHSACRSSFLTPANRPLKKSSTMLVTPEFNRRNRNQALALAGLLAVAAVVAGTFFPPALFVLLLCPVLYWLRRRRCRVLF